VGNNCAPVSNLLSSFNRRWRDDCSSDNHLIATIALYFDIDETDSVRLPFLIKGRDLIST